MESDVRQVCEDVVHVLIGDEDPRFDNLKELEIPEKVRQTLEQMQEQLQTGDLPEIEYVASK